MKKFLTILFILPLIFISCEKEDDSPESNNKPTTGYYTYQGNFYKTTDSGNSWTQMSQTSGILDISMVNETTGYYTYQGNFYKTTDSGNLWTQMSQTSGILKISMVN